MDGIKARITCSFPHNHFLLYPPTTMKLLSLLPCFLLAVNIGAYPYSCSGDTNQRVLEFQSHSSALNSAKTFHSTAGWSIARMCQPNVLTVDQGRTSTSKDWPSCLKPDLGEGVRVYVIDSGVDGKHPAFGGRVEKGANVFNPEEGGDVEVDDPKDELPSHGTRVAAVIAGEDVGIAPKATIVPYNVYDPKEHDISTQGVVKAMDMIIIDFQKKRDENPAVQGVINISGEISDDDVYTPQLVSLIKTASDLGLHIVLSAGNDFKDVTRTLITRYRDAKTVITVGGIDIQDQLFHSPKTDDQEESGSNYGDLVDIYAPGQNVNTVATTKKPREFSSGTSYSAPLVAGIVAGILSQLEDKIDESYTPAAMRSKVIRLGAINPIENMPRGSKNKRIAQFDPKMMVQDIL
ncbi:peptidase S8/S53 domain-containing protein [Flagelloscypha sp. PMI_526]|nr:peptidase S8/S53 domain-containing protein [Flagelloscypha sp. PMI_526]